MVCRYFGCSSKVLRHWGISSIGRASALQAEGQEFDSPMLHSMKSGFFFGGVGLFRRNGWVDVDFATFVHLKPAFSSTGLLV